MPNKEIKAKPRSIAGVAELYPAISFDTAGGKPINSGVMFMKMYVGEATIKAGEHGVAKDTTIQISSGMNGTTILECNGRSFMTDLRALIDLAIENGLIDPKPIDFDVDNTPKKSK